MTVYEAVTDSGAVYTIDTSTNEWTHRGYPMGCAIIFQAANVDEDETPLCIPWDDQTQWADVEAPVVGRRMYLSSGYTRWRISTPVVSVREV